MKLPAMFRTENWMRDALKKVDTESEAYQKYREEELPRLNMFLKTANIRIFPFQKELLLRLHYANMMAKEK